MSFPQVLGFVEGAEKYRYTYTDENGKVKSSTTFVKIGRGPHKSIDDLENLKPEEIKTVELIWISNEKIEPAEYASYGKYIRFKQLELREVLKAAGIDASDDDLFDWTLEQEQESRDVSRRLELLRSYYFEDAAVEEIIEKGLTGRIVFYDLLYWVTTGSVILRRSAPAEGSYGQWTIVWESWTVANCLGSCGNRVVLPAYSFCGPLHWVLIAQSTETE